MNPTLFRPQKRFTGDRVLTKIALCAFLGLGFPALAVDRITATVVITNAPTTNGMTFVVTTTSATTRTWTNSVQNSSLQVLTNSTGSGCATNLANNLAFNPPLQAISVLSGASNITIAANAGVPLTITGVGAYFSVTYATQTVGQAWTVRVPLSVEADNVKTNISSGLSAWLEHASNTNAIDQNALSVSELIGLTNAQTVAGIKQFTNVQGHWRGQVTSTNLNGIAGAITNGVFKTNSFDSPSLTNGVNYGNAFSSPGSAANSEEFGSGSLASGQNSLAIGFEAFSQAFGATAVGNSAYGSAVNSSAFGVDAQATAEGATALGNTSTASGTNSIAIGQSSEASYNNSVALGVGAITTQTNQIRLGTAAQEVSIAGGLRVSGVISNAVFGNTNAFPAGSDVSFGRYAITTLANGANSVSLGTNVFIQVSGPSGAFTINGMDAQPNRDGALRIILNLTTQNMTIAHDSGTEPTAANRIYTMTGSDHATTGNGCAMFIYSGAASRWILINLQE